MMAHAVGDALRLDTRIIVPIAVGADGGEVLVVGLGVHDSTIVSQSGFLLNMHSI